jgi:hypothetical protein
VLGLRRLLRSLLAMGPLTGPVGQRLLLGQTTNQNPRLVRRTTRDGRAAATPSTSLMTSRRFMDCPQF